MIPLIGSIITAFAVSVFIFPILIKYSQRKKILDIPGHRRIHKRITPSIGGVAIFAGFCAAIIVWLDFIAWPELKSIIGILFIVFVLGLCDDLVHIKPHVKLLGQIISASLAFFLLDVKLTSTYGLLGSYIFPDFLSFLITVFTIVIITNSFNLIDGIDGLAGTFSTVCFFFFGVWFHLSGEHNLSLLCFSATGAIAAFLVFNWEPSRIFMGDTGALFIGMLLSILTIQFINTNEGLAVEAAHRFTAGVPTALAVIIIPVIDTVRIIIIRVSKGVSPLKADKRHIHHYLVRLGFRHSRAVMILTGVHLFFIATVVILARYDNSILFPAIIVVAIILSFVLDGYLLKKIS